MPRQENTRELFVLKALKLFGERGFDAVKISEIAEEVGCTAPALYKHYQNKQQMYDELLEMGKHKFDEHMNAIYIDPDEDKEHAKDLLNLTLEQVINIAKDLLLQPLRDENATNFRKLMTLEQFHMKELADLYNDRYIDLHFRMHAKYFKLLMEAGKMTAGDPYTRAVTYFSPIIVAIGVLDRDPEREEAVLKRIEDHVIEFHKAYRTDFDEWTKDV